MHDLVAWLTQIWDEEQAIAEQASPGHWHLNAEHDEVRAVDDIEVCTAFALSNNQLRWTANHIALHDPAAVLARIAADRQILALHQPDRPRATEDDDWGHRKCAGCGWQLDVADGSTLACPTVRLLASAYADRPGYQEEWRP